MANEQIALSFNQGITNVPSDATCDDNELEESLGMVFEDGEHRPIQKPTSYMTVGSDLNGLQIVYVHKTASVTNYIGIDGSGNIKAGIRSSGGAFSAYTDNLLTGVQAEKLKVTSIGKTLVIASNLGLKYFIWKTNKYEGFGGIPDMDCSAFMFQPGYTILGDMDCVSNSGVGNGIINDIDYENGVVIENDAQEQYNDFIVGLYTKNELAICRKKAFTRPFFVRFALELYDGTYHYISNPILLFPSITRNSYLIKNWTGGGEDLYHYTLYTFYAHLYVNQLTDYSEFSDIVKDVVVFASEGVGIYDLTVDQIHFGNRPYYTTDADGWITIDFTKKGGSSFEVWNHDYIAASLNWLSPTENLHSIHYYYMALFNEKRCGVLAQREERDIVNDLKSTSIFYKLCSLGLKPVKSMDVAEKIGTHTLENLTTQDRLTNDDYYSRCKLDANFIYAYNSRLNIADAKRGFFGGFGNFMPYDDATLKTYDIYVTIRTDQGDIVVHRDVQTYQFMGYYFYYPDPRAKNVVIMQGSTKVLDAELTEHTGLNGAYYLAGLPKIVEDTSIQGASIPTPVMPTPDTSAGGSTAVTANPSERLENYIITSEADNPFVFKAAGYYRVGTGRIIGMSSITQALSQGQFGQYPLIVFSESGIWALSVASTGYYSAVHPMSRDVCNNANAIIQTDGAVFFTSEKGLMVVVSNEVACVSEQLRGKTAIGMNFHDFLKGAEIGYDYRDGLLWIGRDDSKTFWIYNFKSKTFSHYEMADAPQSLNFVNNYPDFLMQIGRTLHSFMGRPDCNLDETEYAGTIITRPMKLDNALALKSIRQIRNVSYMDGSLTYRLFASNDLKNWAELTSLRSMPWKYYKIRFDFTKMKATDRFAGTVIITQERRTNKLR